MNNKSCTGVIFKGRTSQFFDKKKMSFQYRESFSLLKRKSCKCKDCMYLIKCIETDGDTWLGCNDWFVTFNHKAIVNDEIYRLSVKTWDQEDDYYGESYCFPDEIKMEIIKQENL